MKYKKYLKKTWGLIDNPYKKNILGELYVEPRPGFLNQVKTSIEAGTAGVYIIAPTGWGKTTLLKRLAEELEGDFKVMHVQADPRPLIFARRLRLAAGAKKYEGTDFDKYEKLISAALSGGPAVILVDNSGLLSTNSQEFLRQLTDNNDELGLVFAGLPEDWAAQSALFGGVYRRRFKPVELLTLDQGGTAEFIVKREYWALGQLKSFNPNKFKSKIFTSEAIKEIHKTTKGDPDEVRKICSDSLQAAYFNKIKKIDVKDLWRY